MRKLFLILFVLACVAACDQAQNQAQVSLAQKVAAIDAGHFVESDDPAVEKIEILLESLYKTTGYSEEKIADQAAMTRNLIREKIGKTANILDILKAANNAETVKSGVVKLEEYFAVYATLSGS